MADEDDFYPDIDDYLFKIDLNTPIEVEELDWLVKEITAKTNLTKVQAELIISAFFSEIRNRLIRRVKTEIFPLDLKVKGDKMTVKVSKLVKNDIKKRYRKSNFRAARDQSCYLPNVKNKQK